jgi:hypothetical protein
MGSLLLILLVASQSSPEVADIAAVLDDFHRAAAAADEARYFAHFDPDGVFLGTDAGERWSVAEFRVYAHARFAKGKGWTYRPRDRHVTLTAEGIAYFDELLDNDKYGVCRGSGVLRRVNGMWRIAQYNLSFTVPNDAATEVVRVIRGNR